ncbi:hypothetical protein A2833_03325 [Candidatus Azambacteria bacterium RIFCSPHIGHO2_01_FULL_44_55]|uniref:Uncharacterized protein n=1 Tax=Candidatus Azambacteria bacterium RIFCSPLOWO2_02_FULL_44_14 TaxID=1797306 RepID=A0A1F5CAL6_9BACT|nr:MAG: hypothetical protein A3C78_00475 [Candidatus Azambacteria bacterium RIFCSPHIGHO2_02_FULL_45_18]OGD39912.1 MAG: hypothetical protein A3I30_01555 [Candidatus Azambacteria bacterium RIFCSPLOWO2_02_FULL_44_14]OGD40802.1 MAG: hypothetical protein A2833_03325 [Candidatus Azambacteria bacterium RIFCSPHIGHO2_01_FULL_44_55]
MGKYTIELSEKAEKDMDFMKMALEVDNKTAVIKKALGTLNFLLKEHMNGSKIIIENEKTKTRREIVVI